MGKHKLSEMGALNMKLEKVKKLEVKDHHIDLIVFKHGCSLKTHLELWRKRQYLGICIFQKIPR